MQWNSWASIVDLFTDGYTVKSHSVHISSTTTTTIIIVIIVNIIIIILENVKNNFCHLYLLISSSGTYCHDVATDKSYQTGRFIKEKSNCFITITLPSIPHFSKETRICQI
jgi:hypothetical protein